MSWISSIFTTRATSTLEAAYSANSHAYIDKCQECSAEFSFLLRSSSGEALTTVLSRSISRRKDRRRARSLVVSPTDRAFPGVDLVLVDRVIHSVDCTESSRGAVLFQLRVAKVALNETCQSVLAVSRDPQRPAHTGVGAANALLVCHLGRQRALEQMDAADPRP